MRSILLFALVFISAVVRGQDSDVRTIVPENSGLHIGGYGQINYSLVLDQELRNNSNLDVNQLVLLLGYRFNERVSLVSEIEFEHVKEVYVEQAYIQYRINGFMNFRSGLLLIPMGVINQYHEPVTFNGVERPLSDKYITPTTWREIGTGLQGAIINASLSYQVYIVNGLMSFNGSPALSGASGLRGGRQKGAESFMSSPSLTTRVEYFGVPHLKLGVSGYMGKTQSVLYDGLMRNATETTTKADSSVIGIRMVGLDMRYNHKAWQMRGQLYLVSLENTKAYNTFTGTSGSNDLGSGMIGYYVESGYNLLHRKEKTSDELVLFLRCEFFDTHHTVSAPLVRNDAFHNTIITTGLGWKMAPGAVLKSDIQFRRKGNEGSYEPTLFTGVAFMF